jgi:hypothetical protein
MFKRLTDEEMSKLSNIFSEGFTGRVGILIAQAQLRKDLKKMIEWGEEQCPHSMLKKQYCAHCWQELKEQVERMK